MQLNRYIDHTFLKPEGTLKDIEKLIDEAIRYEFYSVCIHPFWVKTAHERLNGTNTQVATVVGFPLGANTMGVKIDEAQSAVEDGADELDMVMNIGKFKMGDEQYVLEEINAVKEKAGERIVKVIVETCLLADDEKKRAAELIKKSNADFIKTSTGFSSGGADIGDIRLFKSIMGDKYIKASGGIRTKERALEMIEAGAMRIGASSSVSIMEDN
ncbi:MAG: deoxyribose-phosphate aldolase [bacterium]